MDELKKLVNQYPNDMDLGGVIRKLVNETIKVNSTKNITVDDWYIRENTD